MQTVSLGKTGFQVSRFGMGCMRLPTKPGGSVDDLEAIRMIRYAADHGVNYFDTAFMYHGGESERVLGRALQDGYRERVRLVTKLPGTRYDDPEACLDEQLAKLQTDHLDVYLLHGLNARRWPRASQEILGFLDRMKEKGKILNAGFSFHDGLRLFKEIVDAYAWEVCQIQLNFVDTIYQAGLEGLGYAAGRGVAAVVMEPLKGGLLAESVPAEARALWMGGNAGRTPAEWALRWLADLPAVTVVLSGVSTMGQLEENIAVFQEPLTGVMTDAEKAVVASVKEVYDRRVAIGCTACSYCMPCPHGVNIPQVFRFHNVVALGGDVERAKGSYKRMLTNQNSDATRCTECAECEELCPQELPIIQGLKDAHAVLT